MEFKNHSCVVFSHPPASLNQRPLHQHPGPQHQSFFFGSLRSAENYRKIIYLYNFLYSCIQLSTIFFVRAQLTHYYIVSTFKSVFFEISKINGWNLFQTSASWPGLIQTSSRLGRPSRTSTTRCSTIQPRGSQ